MLPWLMKPGRRCLAAIFVLCLACSKLYRHGVMASSSYLTGEPWGDRGWNGASGLDFPCSWHGRGLRTPEPENHARCAMLVPKLIGS